MKTLSIIALCIAATALPGVAAAQSPAPTVSARALPVPAPDGATAGSCRTHQTGASDCTHDRGRSRRVATAWLGFSARDEAAMTAQDWAEIDKIIAESNGAIHNRSNSMLVTFRAPTTEEVADAGAAGTSCPAEAIASPSARVGAGGTVHLALKTKGSCHWAYGSKKRKN